jgi:predicted kinase
MVKLVIMCGVAGAGKTTFSKKLQAELNCERLSSDELRAVFLPTCK